MRRVIPLVLALAGAGCFSMTQEIWIHADGTGRVLLDVGFSDQLLAMGGQGAGGGPAAQLRAEMEKTKAEMAADPTVSAVETSERSEGGMRHFVMDVRLRSATGMKSVKGLAGPHGEAARTNDVRVEELPNGHLLFAGRYEVPPNPQLDELRNDEDPTADAAMRGMMAGFFADKYFTVRLHAPRIVSANGTLDAERRTVEWKTPMVEVIAPGAVLPEMRAEIDMGRGRWMWIAGGVAAGLLAVGGAAFGIVRARRG
jgi:hypothetical protein